MAMTDADPPIAWMEKPDSESVFIRGPCSIGRAASNEIVLPDEKVSRRHAIIHVQGQNEFWLVDLGSRNGTFLNGRRVFQPTRLNNRDRIDICQFHLLFRQAATSQSAEATQLTGVKTILEVKPVQCWMFVADIISSTQLNRALSAEEISVAVGGWLAECKQIAEEWGGGIDKYLGDGFLAFWHHREQTCANLLRAVAAYQRLQAQGQPPFRMVLHYGQVFAGRLAAFGQESLFGEEVNFVFRMEKLAASLREPRLLSEPAATQLLPNLAAVEIGPHGLPGFKGQFLFWRF